MILLTIEINFDVAKQAFYEAFTLVAILMHLSLRRTLLRIVWSASDQ